MKLLTVAEVADRLSVSESLIYRLTSEGKLRFYRLGHGAIRFSEEQIVEYLASREVQTRRERTPARVVLQHLRV
jgi:excisionase family DNA binding protein